MGVFSKIKEKISKKTEKRKKEKYKSQLEQATKILKETGEYDLYTWDFDFRYDRDFYLELTKKNVCKIFSGSSEKSWKIFRIYKNDKEIMTEIIKHYPAAFAEIGEELEGDKQIASMSVENGFWQALIYASKELREDEEFVLKAVKAYYKDSFYSFYSHFNYACGESFPLLINYDSLSSLFSKKDFVIKAVSLNGMFLKHVGFRDDKEVVMAAVKENGFAIKYADKNLQQDEEVIVAAIKQNVKTIEIVKELTDGKTKNAKTTDRRIEAPEVSEDKEHNF